MLVPTLNRTVIAVFLLCSFSSFAAAQEEFASAEEQAYFEQMQALLESLDPQSGEISLGDDLVTMQVPENFYFLSADDAETVLAEFWGNPPGQDVLGMLFPAEYTPMDYAAWAVTIEYADEGHVSDDDAAEINYADLLREMQADTRATNSDRVDAGYEAVELLGWAEPPHYDAATRKLYWAKKLQFGGVEDTTLNYEIRALGRTGFLSMTFVAAGSQLEEINANRESVLSMASFNPGNRYEDFDSSVDRVAAYGVGALVAGKIAAKTGMLAVLFVFLKKFAIFILIGLAAFGKKIIGFFRSDELKPPT